MTEDKPWRNAELLEEMYNERMLSTHQIAEEMGTSQSTVYHWMQKFGIETRDRKEAVARANRRGPAAYKTDHHGYESWWVGHGDKHSKVRVHRLAAIAHFGTSEVRGKVVHHKNSIPWDNRKENLELMSASDHNSMHAKEQSRENGRFA